MTQCQVCEGRAQLFLCTTHIGVLHSTLKDLPWWLDRLTEAALGHVRLGDAGRRGTRARELDEYTGPDDANNADKLHRAITEGKFALDKVLAGGRINAKAARLYAEANNDLTTWVRHLCEARGVDIPALNEPKSCARWLRANTNAIATDKAAKECYTVCVDLIDRIRQIINRPEPPRFCGPCTTELSTEQRAKLEDDRTHCMVQLYAPRKADVVMCPFCKTEHDTDKLFADMLDEADEYSFTISDLVDHILPKLDLPIPKRTLQHWAKVGDLTATGFVANVARYQLSDVRELGRKRQRRNVS